MAERRIHISVSGALMLAALIFLTDFPLLRALLTAAAIHELGHILALYLCGARIVQLRVELCGLCLISTALCSSCEEAFCALAGPLAGLLWAAASAEHWPVCAGLSFLLSLYNLLPALPLDGGRALISLTGSRFLLKITGAVSAAALLALALWAPLPLLLIPAFRLWLEAIRA